MANLISRKRNRKRPTPPTELVNASGEIVRTRQISRINRLKARALRDRWGANDVKLKEIAESLLEEIPKPGTASRDKATLTSAVTGLLNYGLNEKKFELEKIKVEVAVISATTGGKSTHETNVSVTVAQQFNQVHREALENDPDYLEYLERKELNRIERIEHPDRLDAINSDSVIVGQDSLTRPVHDADTLTALESGRD